MKNFIKERFRLIVIVFISMILSGCYTLLNHPPTAESGFEESGDFTRCIDCHNQYFSVPPHGPLYSDPWYDYCVVPWWYDRRMTDDDTEQVPVRGLYHDREFIVSPREPGTSAGAPPAASGQNTGTAAPVIVNPAREADDPGNREAVTREETKEKDPAVKEKKQHSRVTRKTKEKEPARDEVEKKKKSTESEDKKDSKGKKRDP